MTITSVELPHNYAVNRGVEDAHEKERQITHALEVLAHIAVKFAFIVQLATE
ncbi:MAG: hypothetical protein NVSMB46_06480 [Candidatus Saccharimonadales bacterium]